MANFSDDSHRGNLVHAMAKKAPFTEIAKIYIQKLQLAGHYRHILNVINGFEKKQRGTYKYIAAQTKALFCLSCLLFLFEQEKTSCAVH